MPMVAVVYLRNITNTCFSPDYALECESSYSSCRGRLLCELWNFSRQITCSAELLHFHASFVDLDRRSKSHRGVEKNEAKVAFSRQVLIVQSSSTLHDGKPCRAFHVFFFFFSGVDQFD